MKLIFEYEEEITEHVPDVDDNKEKEQEKKQQQQRTLQLNYQKI
jgi:hypothetical protein